MIWIDHRPNCRLGLHTGKFSSKELLPLQRIITLSDLPAIVLEDFVINCVHVAGVDLICIWFDAEHNCGLDLERIVAL